MWTRRRLIGLGIAGVALILASPVGRQTGRAAAPSALQAPAAETARTVALPNRSDSLKFAVLGDFGTGGPEQYALARRMASVHQRFPYQLAMTVGDNLYGSERPQDFAQKFEKPYRALLDEGVIFHASLGNHDSREQRFYAPFNMEGKLYYAFSPKAHVRFFVLESSYMDPEQVAWVKSELSRSTDDWKIAFFHHPLYSSARRHGSDVELRAILEPLFVQYDVSVVFTGHDHVYERLKPQKGIVYFVVGSGGQLRAGDLDRRSNLMARGFDAARAFLVAEIAGDELTFQAVSEAGEVVDSGIVTRRQPPKGAAP